MARFDVYRSQNGELYLLDCQSDWLDHFDTRFVVPLVFNQPVRETSRLHPTINVRGEKMIMATQLAAAVAVSELGTRVANVSDQHFAISDALDMLISDY
jgi:toxin CcdB